MPDVEELIEVVAEDGPMSVETGIEVVLVQLVAMAEQLTHLQGVVLHMRAQLDKLTPLAEVFENFGKVMEGGGGGLLMSKMLGG